jgi:hypothetical protein
MPSSAPNLSAPRRNGKEFVEALRNIFETPQLRNPATLKLRNFEMFSGFLLTCADFAFLYAYLGVRGSARIFSLTGEGGFAQLIGAPQGMGYVL